MIVSVSYVRLYFLVSYAGSHFLFDYYLVVNLHVFVLFSVPISVASFVNRIVS